MLHFKSVAIALQRILFFTSASIKMIHEQYYVKYVPKTQAEIEYENNPLAPCYNVKLCDQDDPDAKLVTVAADPNWTKEDEEKLISPQYQEED